MMEASPLRPFILERSGNQCEAMVKLPRAWARCGRRGVDDHHMLTRARGGHLLDAVWETYHHLGLCRAHHTMVDEYGYESGLLLDGYVMSFGDRIVYQGTDPYLSQKYGA